MNGIKEQRTRLVFRGGRHELALLLSRHGQVLVSFARVERIRSRHVKGCEEDAFATLTSVDLNNSDF